MRLRELDEYLDIYLDIYIRVSYRFKALKSILIYCKYWFRCNNHCELSLQILCLLLMKLFEKISTTRLSLNVVIESPTSVRVLKRYLKIKLLFTCLNNNNTTSSLLSLASQ